MDSDEEDDDPIIWPPVPCGNAEDPDDTAAAREANAPPLLPAKRPRALTLPLSSGDGGEKQSSRYMLRNRPGPNITKAARKTSSSSGRQRTADQSQSRLLSMLPTEIRRIIWRHAVGGQLLHIARVPNRLVALECAQQKDLTNDLETLRHDCWCMTRIGALRGPISRVYRPKSSAQQPTRPANLLPLLQTCRLVYTEAVSELYQDNIFDTDHVDTLIYMKRCILPRRLHQIRRLNFSWDSEPVYPDNPRYKIWREACNVLASLSGLQELTIHLTGMFGANYESKSWVPLLDGLTQVNATRRYDVYIPWSEGQCRRMAVENDFPFTLVSWPQKPLIPRKTARGETLTLF